MKAGPDIARVAALIGDPARANMLSALMSGRALTASELAAEAGIAPPTASSHLAKLEGEIAPGRMAVAWFLPPVILRELGEAKKKRKKGKKV